MPSFADLALDPAILKSLERMQYKEPSPIQAEAIPLILQRLDLIALAETDQVRLRHALSLSAIWSIQKSLMCKR